MTNTNVLTVTIRISEEQAGQPLEIFDWRFEPVFFFVNGKKRKFSTRFKFPKAGEYTLEMGLYLDKPILYDTVERVVVTSYSLPDGIEGLNRSFGGWMFECPIQIPSTVKYLKDVYCSALTPMTVVIPEGVTDISGLKIDGDVDLHLPSTIEYIQDLEVKRLHIPAINARVSNLEKCQDITLEPGGRLVAKDGWIIDSEDDRVVKIPSEFHVQKRLVIPSFVKNLGHLGSRISAGNWSEIVVPKETVNFEAWQYYDPLPYWGDLTVYFEAETLNESQQSLLDAMISEAKMLYDRKYESQNYDPTSRVLQHLFYVGGVQVWPNAEWEKEAEQRRLMIDERRREQQLRSEQEKKLQKMKEMAAVAKREQMISDTVSAAFHGVTKAVTWGECKQGYVKITVGLLDNGLKALFTIYEKQLKVEAAAARKVYDAISPVFEKYATLITRLNVNFGYLMPMNEPQISVDVVDYCGALNANIFLTDDFITPEDYQQFCLFAAEVRQSILPLGEDKSLVLPKLDIL